ncbi:MAG: 3-isopropylmalate dehydratase small subunit [Peptococcaceae bacterium]|nr:3-isopropylmalate dehydratase small subunit [Peptococcaceae bacterium]
MSAKAWKVGDNIDTDLIIAARYLNDASDENMRNHCMEDVIPDYANTIAPGDVLVAGSNFGCGSSREHAPISIKVAGTSCVIAESFARIFYRNAINIGLPIIESPEAAKAIDQGDELDINLEDGVIKNLTKNETYHFEKFPAFIQKIVESGNLLNYVKEKVGQ